jgi:Heparinase II/III-like protein/Heparinase II/III N-terminus
MTTCNPQLAVGVGLVRDLRRLELSELRVVGPWKAWRSTRKAMLGGRFYVYGREARLAPPIDWLADPYKSRTWCYELHTLSWLKEALARHAKGGDVEVLAVARDVVLDWARAHMSSDGVSEFAWYDMAVGLRAPYVGYVLRACLAEEMLSEDDAELLLETAERHGGELARGGNYSAGNNHGLFQDEGLYLLARLLPALPAAAAWRELAVYRLKTTLRETVSFEDGAHLEHSPAYQLAILDLVARLATNVSELPGLPGLLDRMRRTVAWQTTPAGRMAQLGDTDDLPAPRWARATASSLRGMNALLDTGQAFVREGDGYLAVSAAYHSPAHKHSDDTGFILVEKGQVILGDAGRWGYYEDEPDRLYARSAAAHNILAVDGRDFGWREAEPYGSGLIAAGEGAGWYAIVVGNPLLRRQGVEHRRVLLYRPAQALVVVDDVRSSEEHEYVRRFHFGPEVEVEENGQGRVGLVAPGTVATMTDLARDAETALDRGQDEPRSGWAYPGDRERTPAWTATLRSRAKSATYATTIALGGDAGHAKAATVESGLIGIEFSEGDPVTVTIDGRQAYVDG